MKYKAAIFDMDGTILDTLDDLWASVNASLRWAGYPERSREEVRAFVGHGAKWLIDRAVPETEGPEAAARVLAYYKPWYEAHAAERTGPYPGIPEALAALKAAGVKLAVVSNKPDPATRSLAARYFPGLFDAVIGAREGIAVKPAPNSLRAAMEALGVSPEETVYVGDSDVDIATAKNAGTRCLSVTWGFREEAFLRQSGAMAFAHTGPDLTAAILG